MRIAVCVKYVPVLRALRFDPETRRLVREGVPGEVSGFDVRALGAATALRTVHGGEVVVVTMGPPAAREALTECLALGADRGLHVLDLALAGSDTLATARALAAALRREAPDLVLLGRASTDAETGQVGPETAELLGLPQVTGVRRLAIDPAARTFVAERETDEGFETVEGTLPVVVTAAEDLAEERFPTKAEREAAATKPIATAGVADIGLSAEDVGNADPQALVVATSALQAVELVGLPEGRIPLAQAAVYVACAPKSNAAYLGIEKAMKDVEQGRTFEVPAHLKDASYKSAQTLGRGEGYKYAHDYQDHHVKQAYLPQTPTYYEPTELGYEKIIKTWLAQLKRDAE